MSWWSKNVLGLTSMKNKNFDYDANDTAKAFYDQMMDPQNNLSHFQRMATDAGPGMADLMRVASATGGNQAIAGAQALQGQNQANETALNAFGNYRIQSQGQALQGLQLQYEKDKYIKDQRASQRIRNANQRSSFANNVFKTLASPISSSTLTGNIGPLSFGGN